jgi:hypothetical protein
MHEAVYEDTRRVDLIGIEFTGFDNDLRFRYGDFAAGGGGGIEVARRSPIDEVAVRVGLPGFDQREVGLNAALEDVCHSIEVLVFFAFGNQRPYAGARVEAGNARAAGTHAFGERALRRKFNL